MKESVTVMTKIKILIDDVEVIVFDVISEVGLSESTLPSFPAVLGVYFKKETLETAKTLTEMIINSLAIKNITTIGFSDKFDMLENAVLNNKNISVKLLDDAGLVYDEIHDIKSISYAIYYFRDHSDERMFLSNTKLVNSTLKGDQ
jgi:hypothetical protein